MILSKQCISLIALSMSMPLVIAAMGDERSVLAKRERILIITDDALTVLGKIVKTLSRPDLLAHIQQYNDQEFAAFLREKNDQMQSMNITSFTDTDSALKFYGQISTLAEEVKVELLIRNLPLELRVEPSADSCSIQ